MALPNLRHSTIIERENSTWPFWILWHGFAALFLIAVAAFSLGQPLAVSADKIQILFLVCGYLALSLVLIPLPRSPYVLLPSLVVVGALGFGGAYLLLRFAHLPASPSLLVAGAIVAGICALVPYLSRWGRIGAAILVVAAGLAFVAAQRYATRGTSMERRSINTALYALNADIYTGLIPPPQSDGGAIESHGTAVILATGEGKFYWITKPQGRLKASPLDIPPPMDRQAYLKSFANPMLAPRLRLTDVIFDPSPNAAALFVAHQAWNASQHCYTQQVSAIPLVWAADGSPRPNGQWRKVFQSHPCIKAEQTFDDSSSGGRLAWSKDGALLMTLGDWGFEGLGGTPPLAQQTSGDYGKILKIDPESGSYSVMSLGHRNPQGLVVADDGQVWETEHGPQGGDEINNIVEGANYGWPYATYGTNYGASSWPLNPDGHDHGSYKEPAFAFVPSVALSPLTQLHGSEFPHWAGDLLAGSLRTEAVWRVRLRGDRVVYVESFSVGHRVRDLTELANGRVLVWSDAPTATLIELSRSDQDNVYNKRCAGCHSPTIGAAAAPDLNGVVGRRIASLPGFPYSAALKSKTGTWTEAELDKFLRNPSAYAPGTTMMLPGVDDRSRGRVIAELKQKSR